MSKRLAGWVACACLGWTGFAHALGLGEIEPRSRLNQQVAATIPVLSASGAELDSLTVQLASNEDFDRAGIERAEFLSTLRFTVENDVIRVSSKQIAREPFVSFLLDVRWSGGRLLREYTLLLDPPTLAQQGTGISAPQATPIGEAVAPEVPAEAPPAETATAEPGTEPAAEPAGDMPAPDAPAETAAAPSEPSAASAEGGMYGPVAPQETLWSIAYKLRADPATITMDQMQVAIFNANPKSFHGGSIRGLMKGSMLRIPSADEARAVDAASAKALVAEARGSGTPIAAAPRPVETPPAEAAPPAPPEPAPSTAETSPPPPTSEAVPPSDAAPAGEAPASEPEPAPVTEPTPQPAPAETQPAEPAPETKPAPTPKPAPIVSEPSLVDTVIEAVKNGVQNPLVQYIAAGIVGLLVLGFVAKTVMNKLAQMRYNRASQQVEAARTAPSAGAGSEDVTQVAEQPPSMQAALDSAGDAPTVVQGGKLAATVAMGSETLQQTMQQTQVQEPAQAATGGRAVDFDVTSNFASETVQINLDAGDPLSEAEFHRAYGLYDEAALMLKQALQKDPTRTDARVKLAEIYFEAGKANEFVEVAKELKGQLPDDKWQPIAIMGSQIAPTNELFSGAGSAGAGTVDLSFDEPAAPAAAPASEPAPAAAAPAGDALEFDLGSLSMETPAAPAAEPAAAAPAAGGDLSLDLGDFDVSAGASAPAAGGGEVVELSSEPVADMAAAPADEAGTKLDLARAYLDMGDADMAKSLLNEVSQQGNDAQKKEAEELLKRASA
jgi:pilus assembly protein FimV